jgi:hypothetical protein
MGVPGRALRLDHNVAMLWRLARALVMGIIQWFPGIRSADGRNE